MSERITTSPHAKERMAEMGLTRRDILEVFKDPILDYPSENYGPTCRVVVRPPLAIPYDAEERRVITVLWHGREGREDRPS